MEPIPAVDQLMPGPTEDRIEALETRIAFQDQAMDDISATVTDLWKQIAALTRKVEQLTDQLKVVQASGGTDQPEPPPPHY